jgi:lysophospholipase L1-like esterase
MKLLSTVLPALLSLGFALGLSSRAYAAPAPLQDVARIVFLGDSITLAGHYVADIDCWLLAQKQDVEILNLGLSSETATDLTKAENEGHLKKYGFGHPFVSERLGRLLAATKPDMVFVCYGMNDCSSLPPDDTGTRRFADAVTHLRETLLKSGVKKVVILTPPVRECSADAWPKNTMDQNLTRYTEWLISMKGKGWNIVDIHTPMRKALDAARAKKPDFCFTKDGVHPGREGHWLMASSVLEQYFGAKLDGLTGAEQFFPSQGAEIRKLVAQRQKIRFDAWMTKIGHERPGVPGGPKSKPGPSVEEATARAVEITKHINALMTGAIIDKSHP